MRRPSIPTVLVAVGTWLLAAVPALTDVRLPWQASIGLSVLGLATLLVGTLWPPRRRRALPAVSTAPPPSLRVRPVVVRKRFAGLGGQRTHAQWEAWVAQLEVRVTREPVTVAPSITYTDRNTRVLRLDGRWADTPLPEHPDRAVLAATISLGERRRLDVAIGPGGELWFALDNRAPFHAYRVSEYQLALPAVIEIEFPGATPARLVFTLREEDGRPVFDFAFGPPDVQRD